MNIARPPSMELSAWDIAHSGWDSTPASVRLIPPPGGSTGSAAALFRVATTRLLEARSTPSGLLPLLMQRAGFALARLALAVAPHARTYWIACGPGNNGGDGFVAACFLNAWGKQVQVSYLPGGAQPAYAMAAMHMAQSLGVAIGPDLPAQFDACLDCLFGIGSLRPLHAVHQAWIAAMNSAQVPVIAADVPTGLDADTGTAQAIHVQADHTLSLLTPKPGLFTGDGREVCGDIWFNSLGIDNLLPPCAELVRPYPIPARAHNVHKGNFGDVAVIGGAQGMTGAAVLAASAALHGGAGRVLVGLLHRGAPGWDNAHPELMFRSHQSLALEEMAVVAGCGGGDAIGRCLENVIQRSAKLVLDADALNQLARSTAWVDRVQDRADATTVLTPHPLEAARLLACSTQEVQADRLRAAQALADRFHATVVLKGSGSIVATPNRLLAINCSGNGALATAGTGDVLAGLIGAYLAQGYPAREAACRAVYRHGAAADRWQPRTHGTLTAAGLAQHL